MDAVEKRLAALEREYGGGGGDKSKWYGTEAYHGIYKPPERTHENDLPSGVSFRR
jgi:hypothetical protein